MKGTSPKQHHFVPRFYLERFTNLDGHVWTFDKVTDKVFAGAGYPFDSGNPNM